MTNVDIFRFSFSTGEKQSTVHKEMTDELLTSLHMYLWQNEDKVAIFVFILIFSDMIFWSINLFKMVIFNELYKYFTHSEMLSRNHGHGLIIWKFRIQ